MDTRYSPEQLELRSATAAMLADLGPRTTADLDDTGRRARLAKAAEAAGWFELRGPGEDDGPLASGVEVAIDRISFDHHTLSKRAKDIGSAAVFVALLLLAMVWALILGPQLI